MHFAYGVSFNFYVVENHKDEVNDVKELVENIIWEYISIDNLLDIVNNFPLVRQNKSFQKIFRNEILRRLDNREIQSIPRRCYKYQIVDDHTEPFIPKLIDALFDQKKELSSLITKNMSNN